jgi:hypothetical protein
MCGVFLHIAAGVEDEVGPLAGGGGDRREAARIVALAETVQLLVGELQLREHVDAVSDRAIAHHALAPPILRGVLRFRRGDPRHRQHEARIDAVVAGLDALAGEDAALRPFVRGLGPAARAQNVEHARHHRLWLGVRDAHRLLHRAGLDTFAATGAGVENVLDAALQGGFKGHLGHGNTSMLRR